jgi:4a-hydroxytetrahydrobiopterin dehydratase
MMGQVVKKMTPSQAREAASKLKGWKVAGGKLRQELEMEDFPAAVAFIRAIARAAESVQHHPDLHLTNYRRLVIELSTHDVGGLSESDFLLAAKIDALPRELKRA